MEISAREAGRMGGLKSQSNKTPEQRRAQASNAAKAAHAGRTPEERHKLALKASKAAADKRRGAKKDAA